VDEFVTVADITGIGGFENLRVLLSLHLNCYAEGFAQAMVDQCGADCAIGWKLSRRCRSRGSRLRGVGEPGSLVVSLSHIRRPLWGWMCLSCSIWAMTGGLWDEGLRCEQT